MSETQQFILKAMAENYRNGHSWDHLDSEACEKAAAEIASLQEQVEKLTRERDFEQSSRLTADAHLGAIISNLQAELAKLREGAEPVVKALESAREFIDAMSEAYNFGCEDKLAEIDKVLAAHPTEQTDARSGVREALHLTEYEIQVLLGTSISGCNMSPDRVFSLDMAWHRLYALDLIDRPDGLAIITEKGREVVSRILSALSPAAPEGREVWRPIETAPTPADHARTTGICMDDDKLTWWQEGNPTHWMPLPAAPALAQEGK